MSILPGFEALKDSFEDAVNLIKPERLRQVRTAAQAVADAAEKRYPEEPKLEVVPEVHAVDVAIEPEVPAPEQQTGASVVEFVQHTGDIEAAQAEVDAAYNEAPEDPHKVISQYGDQYNDQKAA